MPILNIREMGSIGVVSDIAPWDLPPAAFSDGMNFRLSSGKAQSTGGLEAVSPLAGEEIGHIAQSTDLKGNSSWLVCGQSAIFLYDGTSFFRLTGSAASMIREAVFVDPSKWTSAQIGNVTFFNNPEMTPIYWRDEDGVGVEDIQYLPWHIGYDADADQVVTETWADVGMSCNIIRAHKNFLFALGITNDKGQFNDMLHWSHPAEPNGIPFSWRPTIEQPDSIAGSLSLGRGGAIVGGESLRDSFVIYSESALNVLDFTGDALGWRRRAVSETAGLVNPHALVEVKGSHMFFTGDDVLMYDGNAMQSLMHNRLRKRLAANINNDRVNNSWAAHYQSQNEVWFGIPEDGADHPNYAYCFNYRDNNWSIRDLERQTVHAHSGREAKSAYLTWDKGATSWDDESGSWTQAGDRPFQDVMYGLSNQRINDLDPASSTIDGGAVDTNEQTWDGKVARASYSVENAWDDAEGGWDESDGSWLQGPLKEPDAPTSVIAEAGDASALVSWTAPASDGGSTILGYEVYSSEGGTVNTVGGDTFCTFENLVNDTEYTFTVMAFNAVGPGAISAPSNAVTPESGAVEPEPPAASATWDSSTESWDDMTASAGYKRAETWLLRSDLPIGGHEANTTITRVYPQVEGTSTLEFKFGSQQYAGGPIAWAGGPREFTPGQDRKIDIRTTGELHAFEVRSKNGFFKLTGMDIEFQPAGGR